MSLDQAPPPDDASPGYKPDPLGSTNMRRWDGSAWTQEVMAPAGSGMSSGKKWLIGIGSSLVVLVAMGAILGEEEKSDEPAKEKVATVTKEPTSTPDNENDAPESKPATADTSEPAKPARESEPVEKPQPAKPADQITAALEDVPDSNYDANVKDVYDLGGKTVIELETPEGGFEGGSSADMNNMVAAVSRRIFTETDLRRPVVIQFSGGLVNAKTGADLPDLVTGVYKISKPETRQVDWDDKNLVMYGIDWSLYRTMLHSAIKKDD